MRRALALAAFVAVIVTANILTQHLGLVAWLGFVATAGTWVAGFGFVARDAVHESGGRGWVFAAIGAGALISAFMSPQLAFASAVAFTIAELSDYAVYAPLRRSGRTRAALASNIVGAVIDTLVFLHLAGFPLDGTTTQVAVKVGTTSAFVLAVWGARAVLRQSDRAKGA